MKYPFKPESTAYLEPGHFWTFPLSSGKLACGVVLQLSYDGEKRHSRSFLAGLLDWSGFDHPSEERLIKSRVLAHGGAHIKTISENSGEIMGKIGWDDISDQIPFTLSESPGKSCRVQKGFHILRVATSEEQQTLPVFKTWGYSVIKIVAEKHFATRT